LASALPPDITGLLEAWKQGENGAFDHLVEVAYPELHRIALRFLQRERSEHTLQCTALIHEAYLRLVQAPGQKWENRAHFFGFAARLMRGILVDYARASKAEKRGRGAEAITLTAGAASVPEPPIDLLDLNTALDELHGIDPLQSQIVELRYFGGLTIEETAEALAVSASTVYREWILAKTWIRRRLSGGKPRQ